MESLSAELVHAIRLATGGVPDPALERVAHGDLETGIDPVAALALQAPSRTGFLVPDVVLLRLLEHAAQRPLNPNLQARVLIRWARELLADPSALQQRRELADEAVGLAQQSGDPGTLAEVLDGRLHALWNPLDAPERLSTAAEIVELARRAGDTALELRGLFWRFTAQTELGELDAAEATLLLYTRTAELAGDAQAQVVALSRQALLALVRGRLDLAATLTAEVKESAHRAGLPDAGRLGMTLESGLSRLRGEAQQHIAPLREMALRLPGHFFEATAARVMAEAGQDAEALLELDRLLPSVLAGSGPRWLGAVADLAVVAARGGGPEASEKLYAALLPFSGRLVVWGGANMITGTVDDLLGRLAQRLGRPSQTHFDQAVAQEERIGALPWLSATLAVRAGPGDLERSRSLAARLALASSPADDWQLVRDGDDWNLIAGPETARFKDVRGFHYLRMLVSAPGQEIAALDLVAGGAGLIAPPAEPVLDAQARTAYRSRLRALEELLDEAGDSERAARLQAERDALVAELRAATGLGSRVRKQSAEAERARVNATRALRTVLTRMEAKTPLAAAHLKASLRTGGQFRYQPAPGGPQRWRVS